MTGKSIETIRAERGAIGRIKDWFFYWISSERELYETHSDWVHKIKSTQILVNAAHNSGNKIGKKKAAVLMDDIEYKLWLTERAMRRKGINILTVAQSAHRRN